MPERMVSLRKTELLAPAGDLECIEAASRFGADACYIGGSFLQLRAASVGFSLDHISRAAQLLHRDGKKLYVTVNSYPNNSEIPELPAYAKELFSAGADGAIVSDLGAIYEMKNAEPRLQIHVSTQANCQNYKTAEVYYRMGASRVVLGRELSLDEIRELRALCPKELELEAFIHGAMCMSYSGRCLLSAYFNGRSANRGACTQPCRWKYVLMEESRPGVYLPIEEEAGATTILSSADLCTISFIHEIIDAGVDSLKIEGRMKTPYYVATVTNAYRRAIDRSAPLEELLHELECVSHRPYSSGFYFGELKKTGFNDGIYRQACSFAGVVREVHDGEMLVEQRNKFVVGDTLEVLSPNFAGGRFTVEKMADCENNEVYEASHAQQLLRIPCSLPVSPGDLLRRPLE